MGQQLAGQHREVRELLTELIGCGRERVVAGPILERLSCLMAEHGVWEARLKLEAGPAQKLGRFNAAIPYIIRDLLEHSSSSVQFVQGVRMLQAIVGRQFDYEEEALFHTERRVGRRVGAVERTVGGIVLALN
jgi:hypothetical protein